MHAQINSKEKRNAGANEKIPIRKKKGKPRVRIIGEQTSTKNTERVQCKVRKANVKKGDYLKRATKQRGGKGCC